MEDVKAEQSEQVSEETKENAVVDNGLEERLDRLEQSNQRLLDESKSWKSKYQSVKSQAEERETEAMKQTNDFKGLYEKTLEQVDALKTGLVSEKKDNLEKTLRYQVASSAKDAEDMDLLVAAVKMKKKDLIAYNGDNGKYDGVDDAINDLRQTNPGLFSVNKPSMMGGRPGSAISKDKSHEERLAENPRAVLNDEIAELLKKQYGV